LPFFAAFLRFAIMRALRPPDVTDHESRGVHGDYRTSVSQKMENESPFKKKLLHCG